jgi:hypothetical protein
VDWSADGVSGSGGLCADWGFFGLVMDGGRLFFGGINIMVDDVYVCTVRMARDAKEVL